MNWLREQKKNKMSLVDVLIEVMIYICISRGGSRILKRGTHNFITVSMPNLGGSGGMPPRKF